MKIIEHGISYFIDKTKKFATVESFQKIKSEYVYIPEKIKGFTVRHIASRAFYENKYLKHLELPDCITKINAEAFCDCEFLMDVSFYKSENSICRLLVGYNAFLGCRNLERLLTNRDICLTCEKNAFKNCIYLRTIQFHLYQLGNNCFENCFVLNNLVFADNACWKTETFKGCSVLKNLTFCGDVEELLSNTCMNWIAKRNIKCKHNSSIAEFVYSGTHVEFR